jgi:hypothetical protein
MTTEILLILKKRLEDTFPSHYVDLFLNQYTDTENNPLWSTEAWFIEFLPIEWMPIGSEGAQAGTLDFVVHHVSETGYDDFKRIAQTQHTVQNGELHKALHGWDNGNLAFLGILNQTAQIINKVQRITSAMSAEMSSLIVSTHRFRANVFDYTAVPTYQEILATIHLQFNIISNINDTDDNESITYPITI